MSRIQLQAKRSQQYPRSLGIALVWRVDGQEHSQLVWPNTLATAINDAKPNADEWRPTMCHLVRVVHRD
eukprot:COSAG06_NODE_360_length_16832_cov_9.250209_5_plen_69_part_00